jgi:hypothetical protein
MNSFVVDQRCSSIAISSTGGRKTIRIIRTAVLGPSFSQLSDSDPTRTAFISFIAYIPDLLSEVATFRPFGSGNPHDTNFTKQFKGHGMPTRRHVGRLDETTIRMRSSSDMRRYCKTEIYPVFSGYSAISSSPERHAYPRDGVILNLFSFG